MSLLLAASVWARFAANDFYHTALAGGLGVAVLCGVLSSFVVLKRMSFIGQGISHAAFAGVGTALLLGVAIAPFRGLLARDAVIAASCVLAAVAIGFLARRGRLSEDVSIGVCLVTAMAGGVVLMDLRAAWMQALLRSGELTRDAIGFTPSFHDILFGRILTLAAVDAWMAWGLALLVCVLTVAAFKELVFFAFDEEAASAFGLRTGVLYYGLLVLLALAVAAAMRSVGVILAGALLILPGVTARCWTDRIAVMVALSVLVSVAGVAGGFFLALGAGTLSPGPVIVLTLFVLFILSSFVGRLRRRVGRKHVQAE